MLPARTHLSPTDFLANPRPDGESVVPAATSLVSQPPARSQAAADASDDLRLSNDDGTPNGLPVPPVDELKRRIESLEEQLDRAQRMAILGELTAITTHEFNNLLMTMLNYAKIGLRHKDEATRDKALQRIFDSANKAGRLTSGILALARNRSGSFEPTDLRRVVEDSLLLIEREFRKYQIQLDIQLEDVPMISAVGNDLQRVIINLLINARQATPQGGQVQVLLKDSEKTSEVILTVRDNGSGIDPQVLPKIFDPYFSTKSGPDASGRGGCGVGLAACKEIIQAHTGKIRVESTLGKGTAFTIRFPKAK